MGWSHVAVIDCHKTTWGRTEPGLRRFPDERGFFEEIIRASDPFFKGFAQFSWCTRREGTITAWHFHPSQWDWWFVPHGVMKAVLHDLRDQSPTRGNTFEIVLGGSTTEKVLAIPVGDEELPPIGRVAGDVIRRVRRLDSERTRHRTDGRRAAPLEVKRSQFRHTIGTHR